MRLLSCDEMKQVERYTANFGLSYQRMMENAGSACAKYIRSVIEQSSSISKSVVIVCGKGNNGGDGFVIARKLTECGYKAIIVMACGYPSSNDAEFMYKMALDIAVPVVWYDSDKARAESLIANAEFVVDAVFGFSFYGSIKDDLAQLFASINKSQAEVFSVDLPSGTYCDSGYKDDNAIQADHTIAISALKPAHIIHPASDCCGDIFIANIGIPNESYNFVRNSMYTLSANEISSLIPKREETSHKGSFGHLLIISGSENMPGACKLAAKAALRSGVGLVTTAFPQGIKNNITSSITESLLLPLPQTNDGFISSNAINIIESELHKFTAVLVGPGIGICEDTKMIVKWLVKNCQIPLIIDADAINICAQDISIFAEAKSPIILTPHPKEMSRLCNAPVQLIQSNRVKFAKEFSSTRNVFMVLKGSNTVVSSPNAESVYINASGNSGLAKGGSGDVLAGILSALIAQGVSTATACAAAVFIHGHCADKAADRLSKSGMLPSDVIDELARVWRDYE